MLKVEEYKKIETLEKKKRFAWKLYCHYIVVGAPKELNLDLMSRKVCELGMITPHLSTFDVAQKKIFNILESDAYRRFLQWKIYRQLAYPEEKYTNE